MRKGLLYGSGLLILLSILFSTGACTDKKPIKDDSVAVDTGNVDSTSADTLETLLSEQPMPKAADELFDDFFFNFAANRKLQRKRILFPLPVYENGKVVRTIAKIYLTNNSVKQYLFNRIHGEWMLTSLNVHPIRQNSNASFLHFYQRFATDSAFQARSVHDPLHFVGPDPDNDFSNTSGTLLPEQWPSFAPELPHALIYNIIYGQKYTESNQKIFVIRGIANGLETELTFKKIGKEWKLMKLSM